MSTPTSLMLPLQPGPPPLLPSPPPEGEEGSAGMSVAQVLCILRAFWKHSLITSVLVIGLGAALVHSLPKMYVATATVQVSEDNSHPNPLGPDGVLPPSYLLTEVELIQSAAALQPVIDKLDLTHDPQFTHGFTGSPAAVRDVAVASLRDAMTVTPGVGTNLLHISVTYPQAQKAADIANSIAEEYAKQERTRALEPAAEGLAVVGADVKELQRKRDEALAKVAQFRKEHSMFDIQSNATADANEMTAIKQKLLAAQNDVRDLEILQVSPGNSGAVSVMGEGGVPALRGKLSALQEELATMQQSLGDRHPSVVAKQAEIEATREQLAKEVADISGNVQVRLEHARQLVKKYQDAVTDLERRLEDRRTLQEQGEQLEGDAKLAEDNYTKAQGVSEARRYDLPQNGHVTPVERATAPIKATKPNKLKLYILAVMAGLGFGVAWPFAYELLVDRRLRCRDDLERTFRMPVLAQFGPIGAGGA